MKASSPVLSLCLSRMDSPLGTMLIVHDDAGRLRALDWEDYAARLHLLLDRHYGAAGHAIGEGALPTRLADALGAYFAGDLAAIGTLAVDTAGTDFQRSVWAALRAIPAGSTLTYGQLAARIGRPAAVRAVGLANGANPIGIVVPCHRVIGSGNRLTGYAGGLDRKHWLLAHEARHAGTILRAA